MFEKKMPRRDLLKGALAGLAAIPVVAVVDRAGAAAPLKPLDAANPQAKALGYVLDTTKVDNKANPMHKPDQKCNNCVQWQGEPTAAVAGCAIFPGYSVVAPGWCKVWAKKP